MNEAVLWHYLSPQTGRILCDPDHVLVGDSTGVAVPSLTIPGGSLPDLTEKHLWIGDSSNRPIETLIIGIDNLPDLGTTPIFLDKGKIWRGTSSNRPEESDALSELELSFAAYKISTDFRLDNLEIDVDGLLITVPILAGGVLVLQGEVNNLTTRMDAVEILAKYGSKPYINIYLHNNAVSISILANVWTKIQGITTVNSASDFISPASNAIQYNNTHPVNTLITLNVSAFTDFVGSCMLGIAVVRNNTIILAPVNYAAQSAAATQVSMSLTTYASFTNNTDYIEAFILCDQACNIICSEMSFSVATL